MVNRGWGGAGRSGRHRGLVVVTAVVALVLIAPSFSTAASNDAVVLSPAGGEILQSGSRFQVRWWAPEEAEELELFLILAGSPASQLRLTEQLDPRSGRYHWEVPNLPLGSARLMIRWGCDGVERSGPVGAAFTIAAPDAAAALGLRWIDGEWWLTDGQASTEVLPDAIRWNVLLQRGQRSSEVAWAPPEPSLTKPPVSFFADDRSLAARFAHVACRWPVARLPRLDSLRC